MYVPTQRNKIGKDGPKMSARTRKENETLMGNFQNIEDTLNISLYGTKETDDIKELDSKFSSLMKREISELNRHKGSDLTGFIGKLYDKTNKSQFNLLGDQFSVGDFLSSENGEVLTFISEAYQNKKLKQNDIHEISSQLTELREAISVTRDAIVSSDIVNGEISRSISFENENEGEFEQYEPTIKEIEKKFKLNNKIKNFIIPNTLEEGSYYAYIIPYKKIFSDFEKQKQRSPSYQMDARSFHESTLYDTFTESTEETRKDSVKKPNHNLENFIKECSEEFFTENDKRSFNQMQPSEKKQKIDERNKSFQEGLTEMTKRISFYNEDTAIPLFEYGLSSIEELQQILQRKKVFTEKEEKLEAFREKLDLGDGVYKIDASKGGSSFEDIGDCYVRFIDASHMIELKVMDHVIGYYYIMEEDIKPISSVISSTTYYDQFSNISKKKNIIDKLVDQIVLAFDKKFLKDNAEFKKLIAEALTFYDLNQKRVKFQFIPVEYVCAFKVREDEEGNGRSILEPSLFYAKLYLMLLLFNIMSIILYSNDTKVNYIKQSGIDKNIANKIEEIARKKQERSLTLMDLFSYTTLVKKIGSGSELYIPVGRSNERGMETEILQGQQVQLQTELMEFLRKCYILGTGVPDAIINYLNEADFAKAIELANTKFVSRIVDLQMDFNESLSHFYSMLLMYSSNIPEELASRIKYTLTPPKNANNSVKSDMIQAVQSLSDFLINVFFGENASGDPAKQGLISEFKKLLIRENLPIIDLSKIQSLVEEAELNAKANELDPRNNNTDNIDDLGDLGAGL